MINLTEDDTNGGKGWYIQSQFAPHPRAWVLTYGQAADLQRKQALRNEPVLMLIVPGEGNIGW
ncbi:MAG: hypothetical protein MN733_17430 [Nitrososphaera sp.]|nr:hypothetical protein [Nitrososphaera sp.]